MKKRQIVLIPLLMACMVMLLSTVMPHHHHGVSICFNDSHCESGQEQKNCNHDHDSNSCEKECEVQRLFQTDIIKQHHSECDCCPDIMPDQLLFPLLAIIGIDHSMLLTGRIKEVPPIVYRERLHPTTWSITRAGRAPPTVIA